MPPEIEITDDMLRLQAFKVEQKEQSSASLLPGSHLALQAISEFGAKPYTEDEQKELSEIVQAFNVRHGTDFREDDMIRFEQVKVQTNGDAQLINLIVKPMPEQPGQGLTMLVIFEEIEPIEAVEPDTITEPSGASDPRLAELERELRSSREYLQTTIEELETSNEELKSTNEELHSVNEELYTVNAEHEQKISELLEVTADLEHLLNNTEIGTVFLDDNLRVRRFTPPARVATGGGSFGTSSRPPIGHSPGSLSSIIGCSGQVQAAGAVPA